MRPMLVLMHRYVGLVMAGFLVVAGLTGSLLAWNDELEAVLVPGLFTATPPTPTTPPLDPLLLRDRVLQQYPQAQSHYVPLFVEPGRSLRMPLSPRRDNDGPVPPLANDQVYVDPYTGRLLGERRYGDISQGPKNLMPFVYRLHYWLDLGTVGEYAFGIIALLWTLDCFVGAWLTFPARNGARRKNGRPWAARWWPAWKVRWDGGAHKLNFDLHRAGGLWPWAILFVLAWSSVAFNLSEVYIPVMRLAFAYQLDDETVPALPQPLNAPALSWRDARETGRRLMADQARVHGLRIIREDSLAYDPSHGIYRYDVLSSRDIRDHSGRTSVYIDGNSGELKGVWLPTGAASGDTVRMWLTSLHMAALWGWPMKLLVCSMGLVVAMLSVTGVIIWLRKRGARNRSRA